MGQVLLNGASILQGAVTITEKVRIQIYLRDTRTNGNPYLFTDKADVILRVEFYNTI